MLRHILLALGTRLSSGKRCGMNAVGRKLQTNGVIPLWSLRGAVDVQVKDVDAVLAVGVCKEIDKILTHKGYAKVGPFDRGPRRYHTCPARQAHKWELHT